MERRPLHGSGRGARRSLREPRAHETGAEPAGARGRHRRGVRRGHVSAPQGEMSMFGGGIKLDKALLAKVKRYADLAGYSSVEEFITHALEKEIAQLEEADSEAEIKKKLK